ncbi:MAG TPA: biopolymer transporter ExbD [Arenicellales bacterium]|nr:biopolymer transporter ExbD [Arenicellales bacterium]
MELQDKSDSGRVTSRRPLVSLTPLIDVVFILLVFFMLASSFSAERVIEMLTPAGGEPAGQRDTGAALVRVAPDGGVDLNGAPVSRAELAGRVGEWSVSDPSRRYLVQPAPGVTTQQAVGILDFLKSSGAENVSLIRP